MPAIKLYRFVRAADAGNWETATSNARPRFFDANEDAGAKKKHDWMLEVSDAGFIYVYIRTT